MSVKLKHMNIKIKDRINTGKNQKQIEINCDEDKMERFLFLKERLIINFQKEIHNKIETMKILKEIKDKEYYKLDGYQNFEMFTRNYKIAKSQAYEYLRMANAIEEGLVQEKYIIENGIQNSLFFLKDKEGGKVKKSNRNFIRPLRFQLKTEDAYIYYKSKARFTSFLLEKLLKDKEELLNEIMKEYKECKKYN
ncbi:chromosome replication/partitioning protein [Borreliella burgdorferi]|uniref:PF-49 protein n=3 Tax=Borreliella burgdorferi TaxID=139 RepID=O50714_BORBU|nr:chromosome replication/partitioning protein [Borreliella burgdorferi]AAC66028.1 PF-49 protein [Borreliella burgdorferi B31]ACK74190.1 putative plasmid partition protein [Borreliella burgdorferi ZS7]ACN55732.1 putative plasmid partition protein [Borreliella burgdorferi WI91-23]ADQ29946.1 PF-49 protein [Borreliella burgdorferi N40]ATH10715.2 chromosome replication/partitioning protein [Borreliella burgdorferi]